MLSVQNVITEGITDASFSLALGLKSDLWMRSDSLPLSLTPVQGSQNRMCKYMASYTLSRREADRGKRPGNSNRFPILCSRAKT